MLFAFAPIKWITPIKTTRITASMIAYSPTPWPCSDRSLFKLKRPKLLASRKSVGSMFTFSLHRQEWPNSGNPKVTTTGLTTVIKTPIRLGRGLGSPTGREGLQQVIACVFLSLNRVSLKGAFEVLEPDDGKLSRPVRRGPGLSNGVRLLDQLLIIIRSVDGESRQNQVVGFNVCHKCMIINTLFIAVAN